MSQADSESTNRRQLLKAAVALMASTVTVPALAAAPDPIFAAIERHRRAQVGAYQAQEAEDDIFDPAFDEEQESLLAVLTTLPTSAAGLVALLGHLGGPPFFCSNRNGEMVPETSQGELLVFWATNGHEDNPCTHAALSFMGRIAVAAKVLVGKP